MNRTPRVVQAIPAGDRAELNRHIVAHKLFTSELPTS